MALMAGAGVGLLAAYLVATWRIPLWRYFPGETGLSLDFTKMLGSPTAGDGAAWEGVAVRYVALVLVTFALYGVALWVAWRAHRGPRDGPLPLWLLFGFPVLFALALIPMYPPTAVDLFHYHGSSRSLWIHGANPLITAPEVYAYPIAYSWSWEPSPYGPLWSLLGGPITLAGGDHAVAALMGFKALAAASYLGCAAVVWRLVRRGSPALAGVAVVLFAWNPFVLLRVVGNGHNDLVMMLFVLLAFLAVAERRWAWAFVALAAAVLVKFVALLLLPLFVLYAWRRLEGRPAERAREVGRALAPAAAVTALAFAPFWAGVDTFDAVRDQGAKMITSTAVMIGAVVTGGADEPATYDRILLALRVVFVALAAVVWWRSRHDLPGLVEASFVVLALYLFLGAGWFRPWYFLWPVAVAALRPASWLAPMLLALTFWGSFPDLVEQYRGHWTFLDSYERLVAAPVVVAFVPPLLVWAVALAWSGRVGRRAPAAIEGR